MEIPAVVTETAIVGLSMAGTEFVKPYVPERVVPLVAMLLAVLLTIGVRQQLSIDVALVGFMYGLMTCGLYSGVKALARA